MGLDIEAFASAQDFLQHRRADKAACIVLDVRLPGVSGLDLQHELARTGRQIPIIFLTGFADIPTSVRAMKAGAAEFLIKPFREQELLDAIAHAHRRDAVARQRRAELAALDRRFKSLTEREREVAQRVVTGLLNKQVAHQLGISVITVKVHRRHVMEKMGALTLPGLLRMLERLHSDPMSNTYT